MNLKYKIVEIHPSQHSIVVRFYTDLIPENSLAVQVDQVTGAILRARTDYNIDLPIPAPAGDELDTYILRYAPKQWLQTQEDILNPDVNTSMSGLSALIGIEKVAVVDLSATPDSGSSVVTASENIQTV